MWIRTLGLAAAMFTALPAFAADNYEIDAGHSAVMFNAKHLGVSEFYGRFNDIKGTFSINHENLAKSKIDIKVRVASIDTNSDKRDEHLRGADFFNAKQFPEITFKGREFSKKDGVMSVTGDFTLRGVTKRITVDFTKVGEGDDPWGGHRYGVQAEFHIMRSEYGMDYMVGGVSDRVNLIIALEGIKQ